jgi:hypothetical protein
MFFKRRNSRTRDSYVDQDQSPPRSKDYENYDRPDSQHNQQNTRDVTSPTEKEMYARQHQPQEPYSPREMTNGGHNALPMHNIPAPQMNIKAEPMPDLLAQAFNQAVRPYTEKIETLESQVADMQAWIEQMERERTELHAWIDKRGLRPGTYSLLPIPYPYLQS